MHAKNLFPDDGMYTKIKPLKSTSLAFLKNFALKIYPLYSIKATNHDQLKK